jgi:sulfur carrier protein ThiS
MLKIRSVVSSRSGKNQRMGLRDLVERKIIRAQPMGNSKTKVQIRFLAFFGGRDNWGVDLDITVGETLIEVFGRIESSIYEEVEEKLFRPQHPRYAIAINGKIVPQDQMKQTRLWGGEKITVMARLVGG